MRAGAVPFQRPGDGADFLQLDPAGIPVRGLTSWLVDALRAGIADGRLPAGAVLPASRVLAGDLGVSRGVIVEAYQRLREEGLVSARQGAGTTVLPVRRPADQGPSSPAVQSLSARPEPVAGSRAALLPLPWRSRTEIDLSPGVPDLSAFPCAEWLRAERTALAEAGAADLGYGDPRGNERLRTVLAGWLTRTRGLRATPGDIVIVTGVAQALALLGQVLRARGTTTIAVEDPGSRGARLQLAHWGLEPVPIPVDERGLQVDALVRSGLQAAVLTPAHQFPTGVLLARKGG